LPTLAISDGTRIACERIEDSGYEYRTRLNTPWRAFKRVLPEHEISPEDV
jgi:hypothetical protein